MFLQEHWHCQHMLHFVHSRMIILRPLWFLLNAYLSSGVESSGFTRIFGPYSRFIGSSSCILLSYLYYMHLLFFQCVTIIGLFAVVKDINKWNEYVQLLLLFSCAVDTFWKVNFIHSKLATPKLTRSWLRLEALGNVNYIHPWVGVFRFSKLSRPSLVPTQLPFQSVTGGFSP
jgi:hypothetical protein